MIFDRGDKILFIGDSISDYSRAKPVGEGLFNPWGTSYVANAGALLCCMYPELNLRIVNMGISGNQIRDLDERWQTDVLDQKPDYVSVLIGINDVWRQFDSPAIPDIACTPEEYEQNVEQMILKVKDKVKGIFLLTPYYMEPNADDLMRRRMDEYGQIIKKLAEKHGCYFVDFQKMYNDFFTGSGMHSCRIAWDRVHPNEMGATLMARTFLRQCGFAFDR